MRPMQKLKQAEPYQVRFAREDEALARASEQTTSADERLARVREKVSKLEHDARQRPSAPDIPANTFRPAVRRDRTVLRGLVGLLLVMCICGAAIASHSSYGKVAKLIIAEWIPQRPVSTPSLPLPAQPSPSAVQLAAAEPISPSAQTVPQGIAPKAGLASPELAQLLETLMRDLKSVEQEVEQLKATQQQMVSDNANTIGQLKESQEQMALVIAKTSKPNPRPKTVTPPLTPTAPATSMRKPAPMPLSPQARAQP